MSSKVLYKAIDYLRLSKDDNEKSESNSIANQRLLINGEYNVKYAPYGYLLSGDRKRPYDVDPETAPIVQEIFEL